MPNKIKIAYHKTPVGELILGSFEGKLCLCDWRYRKMRNSIDYRIQKGLNAEFNEEDCKVLEKTKGQLTEFFNKKRTEFTVPLLFIGTDFQKTVWNSLLKISFGKTETYLGLSKILGNPKAIRAVATANGANAISILVPCHRIIGTDGNLVGYAGGLPAKKKLLGIENPLFNNQLELF